MILILNDLYADSQTPNRLIITNFFYPSKVKLGTLEEDEYGSLKHTQELIAVNQNLGRKALFSKHPLLDLTTKEKLDKIIASNETDDDSVEIAKIFANRMIAINRGESNICFMDMRAEKVLSPEDKNQFEFLIFGGILGDHPPVDRGKNLRANFANIRQLGTVQMTTDTALLTSREILEEGKPIQTLKFTTEPEIPTDDSVKRYLDIALPIATLSNPSFKGTYMKGFRSNKEVLTKELDAFEKYCKTQVPSGDSDA